jgi:hypothetical protein
VEICVRLMLGLAIREDGTPRLANVSVLAANNPKDLKRLVTKRKCLPQVIAFIAARLGRAIL